MNIFKLFQTILLIIFSVNFISGQTEYVNEIYSGQTKKYSTKYNEKSHGLNLTIKYPQSWREIEGNRPHSLVKLNAPEKSNMVLILITELDEEMSQSDIKGYFADDYLKSIVVEIGGTYLSSNSNLKIDGLKAASYDYYLTNQQMSKSFTMYSRNYIFFYKRYYIQIQCSVGNDEDNTYKISNLNDYFNSYLQLFELIVNSTVIVNQWE